MSMDQLAINDLKVRFAEALLREPNSDPFKAALTIPGIDPTTAMQIAYKWANDEDVIAAQQKLLSDEYLSIDILPSKAKQARDIYLIASSDKIDAETRLKAHRLYAEIRSFIEKPDKTTINIPVSHSNVMIVPEHANDDEWEKHAIKQQKRLTTNGDINGDNGSVN